MAKAALFSAEGVRKGEFELPDAVFGQAVNEALLHETIVIHLGNQRQGTAMGKNRALVNGGGAKPWKQKGTGHARSGSSTSPLWARGGKAFAPEPRDYTRKINKKAKTIALVSAFSMRAAGGQISVFEDVVAATPKTKLFVSVLNSAGVQGKTLIVVKDRVKTWFWLLATFPTWKCVAPRMSAYTMSSRLTRWSSLRVPSSLWSSGGTHEARR